MRRLKYDRRDYETIFEKFKEILVSSKYDCTLVLHCKRHGVDYNDFRHWMRRTKKLSVSDVKNLVKGKPIQSSNPTHCIKVSGGDAIRLQEVDVTLTNGAVVHLKSATISDILSLAYSSAKVKAM